MRGPAVIDREAASSNNRFGFSLIMAALRKQFRNGSAGLSTIPFAIKSALSLTSPWSGP